eukprot:UN14829
MGAPYVFDHRKEWLRNKNMEYDDEKVVENMLESLDENGLLRKYLLLGQIGVRINDYLFLHGGFNTEEALWIIPSLESQNKNVNGFSNVKNINNWLETLNDYCHHNITEYCNR